MGGLLGQGSAVEGENLGGIGAELKKGLRLVLWCFDVSRDCCVCSCCVCFAFAVVRCLCAVVGLFGIWCMAANCSRRAR